MTKAAEIVSALQILLQVTLAPEFRTNLTEFLREEVDHRVQ